MAEITWTPKDPAETKAYPDDWSDEIGSDPIASYSFVVVSGTATISNKSLDGACFTYLIAGGTSGATTTFRNTVTTEGGQVLIRDFALPVLTGANSFRGSTTTKRQLVEQMFQECAMNAWELDITPEEKDRALTRLDAMMHELRARGLDLAYNFPTGIGAGDLDDALGCPDEAFMGLAVLGAYRIASTMGKQMKPESARAQNDAMKAVRAAANGYIPTATFAPGTPRGSGSLGSSPFVS